MALTTEQKVRDMLLWPKVRLRGNIARSQPQMDKEEIDFRMEEFVQLQRDIDAGDLPLTAKLPTTVCEAILQSWTQSQIEQGIDSLRLRDDRTNGRCLGDSPTPTRRRSRTRTVTSRQTFV